MHRTRNSLSQKTRAGIEKLLNARLADALDLAAQAKHAHWNVKGPHFIALHELFDRLHAAVGGHVDVLAERITALGGTARGTVRTVAGTSTLAAYPEDITAGADHLAALADRLADFGARLRAAIDAATRLGDAGSADLFTGVSRDIDQQLWLIEAHLHAAG
ncbi:MAG: DNA starvation/stationary phase protection protein Dps [Gammaproteobacteria bacterium]|nr:DNA starvation/stationary phase protection protein Dps [Gammaproteobacteria bacterium]